MSLKGYQLAYNGRENVACYKAGAASTTGLEFKTIKTPAEGGKFLGVDWALPCSDNGVTVTGFEYIRATDNILPRADATKTLSIQDSKDGGSYGRYVVAATYNEAQYITDSCTDCTSIGDPTIVAPFIFNGDCTLAAPTIPGCVYAGAIYVAAFTGTNNTYTATPLGFTSEGVAIVFAPGTATGTTVSLLAAAMQTAWATELGTGTFVATGNVINFTSTNGSQVAFSITQSQV